MPPFSMKCSDRKAVGARGEDIVAAWLQKQGYEVVQRNFSCKCGEIDLIVRKHEVIAFVEVKRRLGSYFALSEVVTPGKQRRIAIAARYFIAQRGLPNQSYRFDVALVEEGAAGAQVTHIEQAFVVDSYE